MPRPKSAVPTMRRDKHSGQACIDLNRKRIDLGPYGSAEAQRKYHERVQQLAADALGGELLNTPFNTPLDTPADSTVTREALRAAQAPACPGHDNR